MKRYRLLLLGVAGLSVFSLAVLLGAQAEKAAKPAAAKKAALRAASEMKWVDIPDAKGAQQAVTWGNPQKGAHGSFAKFAGGTELPMHTHTAGSRSVVIVGTMLEGLEGQQPKELGPGSYFYIPGELKHTTACKAGAECIIYTDWQGVGRSALVKPPSSGLRIHKARRSPGRFCPALHWPFVAAPVLSCEH